MKRIILVCIACLVTFNLLAQEREKTPIGGRPDIKGDLIIDFGFNTLNKKPNELETRFFPSKTINVYYQYPVNLGNNSGFTFNPGFGFGMDKLSFRDDMTLSNNPTTNTSELVEIQEIYGDDIDVKKHNVSLNYFDIPLEFRYHINKTNYNKGFRVAFGGKVGFLFDSQTKVGFTDENGLKRKIKDKQSYGLNPIRYGLYARMGFPGFNLWGYYGLNQVFEKDKGPFNTEASQINFGISVALF